MPITTVSLSSLSDKNAGQATGLTGMIRPFGGSFGEALIGTYLEPTNMQNRVALLPHISIYDPQTQQRVQDLITSFMAKGADLV